MSTQTTTTTASAETETPEAEAETTTTTAPPAGDEPEQEQPPATEAAAPAPAAAAAKAQGSISRADAAALADIAAQASRLGVTVDLAAALRDGKSPDALRTSVLEAAAKAADGTHVSTAHKPAPGPGEKPKAASPIVAAAQKSAAEAQAMRQATH